MISYTPEYNICRESRIESQEWRNKTIKRYPRRVVGERARHIMPYILYNTCECTTAASQHLHETSALYFLCYGTDTGMYMYEYIRTTNVFKYL